MPQVVFYNGTLHLPCQALHSWQYHVGTVGSSWGGMHMYSCMQGAVTSSSDTCHMSGVFTPKIGPDIGRSRCMQTLVTADW
jgi:hypothetical protein